MDGTDPKTGERPFTLSKSYSPVSHPSTVGHFDLIVKSYEEQRPGGGVGKYICDMDVYRDSIVASLKAQRIMHGSPHVLGRGWKHIGLVAGGTGIAPLLQIAKIVLESNVNATSDDEEFDDGDDDDNQEVQVHLLFINRNEHDILGRSEIEEMVQRHPDQFHVFYALTNYTPTSTTTNNDSSDTSSRNGSSNNNKYLIGRGDVEMARIALPPPSSGPGGGGTDTMIFVCGKDGFVEHWGGPVGRAPPPPGKKKGPKIQGPLTGVLADAGYTPDQVFKY